ncbi:MAG TPA: hypothetical protein VGN83_20850 [Falsiroseomonas sp.]|nr:hypothetical protein [Falsiroseomonas sp.]
MATLAGLPSPDLAQGEWPSRPIRIVVEHNGWSNGVKVWPDGMPLATGHRRCLFHVRLAAIRSAARDLSHCGRALIRMFLEQRPGRGAGIRRACAPHAHRGGGRIIMDHGAPSSASAPRAPSSRVVVGSDTPAARWIRIGKVWERFAEHIRSTGRGRAADCLASWLWVPGAPVWLLKVDPDIVAPEQGARFAEKSRGLSVAVSLNIEALTAG